MVKTGGEQAQAKKAVSFNPMELELASAQGQKARLIGTKCRSCGEYFLGKKRLCGKCFKSDLEEVTLSQKGELYSYTIIHVAPPGWTGGVPYAIGSVELAEGMRVDSQIVGCDFKSLKVGMKMELAIEKAKEDAGGNDVMVYRWRPSRS